MIRRLTYSMLLIGLLSCKNNTIDRPPKPDNLLSEDKMVEVLYDMALISAAKGVNRTMLENKGVNPKSYIFTKHDIDSVQFAQSNAYYAYDIDTYKALYQQVKQRLEKDKQKFSIMLEERRKKRDSIAKANKIRDSIERLNKVDTIKEAKPKRKKKVKADPSLLKKDNKSL